MVDYWLPADICLRGVHVAEEIQLGLGLTVSWNDRFGSEATIAERQLSADSVEELDFRRR